MPSIIGITDFLAPELIARCADIPVYTEYSGAGGLTIHYVTARGILSAKNCMNL